MEAQFVTYEIAAKLKELGFNEPCLARFRVFSNEFLVAYSPRYDEVDFQFTQAPLWQQVIDWFREKKRLNIYFFNGENSKFRNAFSFCITNTHYTLVDFDFENGDSDFNIIRELAILKAMELKLGE